MKYWKFAASLALVLSFMSAAQAQTSVRVRGTITGLDGDVLSVKTREGKDVKIQLAKDATVAVATAIDFENLNKGHYVGVTTKAGPGNSLTAIEIHYLAPSVPEGHTPWDLQPKTMMTNAYVESAVEAKDKRELTVKYKDGTKKIMVPKGIPIVRAIPGSRDDLKRGEYVFIGAQSAADGTLSAARVQVSKDGVKPPQ